MYIVIAGIVVALLIATVVIGVVVIVGAVTFLQRNHQPASSEYSSLTAEYYNCCFIVPCVLFVEGTSLEPEKAVAVQLSRYDNTTLVAD